MTAAVGRAVLDEGGNAVDAALTVAFLQGVVDPAKCGIGGWGTAVCLPAGAGHAVAVDFPSVAGSLARPDQWADIIVAEAYHGYLPVLRGRVNDAGYGAIGIPTCVRGFGELHARFGSLPWGRLLAPAIRAAADGVPVVGGVLGAGTPEWDWPGAVPLRERLALTGSGAARYLRDGRPYRIGERLVQPELAATLATLATEGPDAFYAGSIGARIAADLERGGSTVTAQDLAAYRPRVSDALAVRAWDVTVHGAPPPESGVSIAQAMLCLEGREQGADRLAPATVGAVADALDWVAAERSAHLGDLSAVAVDLEGMLARARAQQLPRPSSDGSTSGPAHTTSVVVIDRWGGAIAMNHSLAGPGGSGVMTEGLGFLYNNTMAGFDARPGGRNAIAPGTARWSAACPTIVSGADGRALTAIAAPGGSRAVAAVLEVLLDLVVAGLDPTSAVALPRFDAHDGVLDLEPGVPAATRQALAAEGRVLVDLPSPSVAACYVAHRDPSGPTSAAADPRWPGSAAAG